MITYQGDLKICLRNILLSNKTTLLSFKNEKHAAG